MQKRYKNITPPLVIVAVIILMLSVFARSSFRRFNYSGDRGYINRCNQKMSSAEAIIEEKAASFEEKTEEKAASFEEKMDRAANKMDEKLENIFD